jgi:hypothetical protein
MSIPFIFTTYHYLHYAPVLPHTSLKLTDRIILYLSILVPIYVHTVPISNLKVLLNVLLHLLLYECVLELNFASNYGSGLLIF